MSARPDRAGQARSASVAAAVADPAWLAHRYDPEQDAVHLLRVPREVRARATFLIDAHLPAGLEPRVVHRTEALASAPRPSPVHFILHSAFCCSTLLARAFDRPGWSSSLSEPVILNDITGWKRGGGRGPDMAEVLDGALTLLARPFGEGETMLIKPSNAVHVLAPAMLALRPDARAVLLSAPLPAFLGSVARKGLDGRLWVRTLLAGLLDDGLVQLGMTARDHLGQTDLQVAAVGWLAQRALFARLVERYGPDRVRTLDSEMLLADPAGAMERLAALFGMPGDANEHDGTVASPAFARHSKSGAPFSAADRREEQRAAAEAYADEIGKVVRWAEAVAERMGVPMAPSAPLIR